jgi:galactokinase
MRTAFAPGRVNLIGEHTDYNGGLSLPFATYEGVTVRAEPARDAITAVAHDLGERDTVTDEPADGWRAYVRGVVHELGHRDPVTLHISGTVPQGSGLSSSAALEVALCLALAPDADRRELAELCMRVEHDWAGADTGLLDQTASLFAREGHALRIDFATYELTEVPLELGDWTLVTLDSGEQHSNAQGGYNARRRECREACERLGIEHLSQADPDRLPEPLSHRARHVVSENARVDATVEALRAGDLARVGELLDASHASLRDDYEASTDAVERAVASLKDAGAAGARMVGGGFGGHVLGLLPPGAQAPAEAREVAPGPGAHLVL